MKALLGTAVAVAGMTVGASYANANTAIVGCEGVILLRNHKLATFPGASIERQEITCAESGSKFLLQSRFGKRFADNLQFWQHRIDLRPSGRHDPRLARGYFRDRPNYFNL
jgi:hypothetical protein